jgi:uncharacterized protein DUF4340
MSSKQLVRFATALAILVIAWGALALVRRPAEDRPGTLALARVDTATVDSIVLVRGHETTTVERAASKHWLAGGFAADSSTVHSFLIGLVDTARATELVAEQRSSHARLGVDTDNGARVTVFAHGKPQLSLVAGKRTPDYDGVYVRSATGDATYALHGALAEPLARAIDDWRDKRVVAVVPESVATVDVERAGRPYTLRRSGAKWELASGKPADSSAVSTLLGDFRDVRATGFATRAQADSIDFSKPQRRTRLLSKSSSVLADLVFDSTTAGTWVRADSGGAVFKLDSWLWGRLAPAESTFAVTKPTTKPTMKPATKPTKK